MQNVPKYKRHFCLKNEPFLYLVLWTFLSFIFYPAYFYLLVKHQATKVGKEEKSSDASAIY